ncbi:MAG: hypothetical protein IPK37_16995 [Austwickia sp.]|jgi:hypothetical protein|nr:MAG: hypothetical protein IPK37_16995 [Austwickia sp.]
MTTIDTITLIVAILLAFAWYLTYTAARLHRLHTRVEGTYAALDAQLVRRAEAVLEVANLGLVDPAAALILADAATESLEAGDANQADREGVESDLTRTIRLILPAEEDFEEAAGEDGAHGPVELGDGLADEALSRLDSAGQRVMMARRFHNDAVTDVLRLRRNVFVRLFFLAGHTDLPRTVEFDDDLGASEGAVR